MSEQFLVLTAASGVADAAADAAAHALRAAGAEAGPPRRLAPGALEIAASGIPQGFSQAEASRGADLDANLVPAEGRRKRLLIADMDSTIIGVECIDELADFAGLRAEVATITEAAMRGELGFEAALTERVRLLAGLPVDTLEACYTDRVRLNPGARVLVRTMAATGARTVLVSGGFTFFAERVAAAAGFARVRANQLEISNGRLTGAVVPPILGREAKRDTLAEEAQRGGYSESAVVAAGDGANDIAMVSAAGLGVGYRPKPALAAVADARLERSDLTAILALQGIPEAEWVQD